jgi:NAD(P)H-dependent FMN reductase
MRVANAYYDMMRERTDNVHLLSLENRIVWEESEDLKTMEQEHLIPAWKFVFVMPEYNGSFPGILKLMIDNSDIKQCWWYKKAMLVGVADGRAGNLRGLDHMTNILNYLKMNVLHNKVPISRINTEFDMEGKILIPATKTVIENQIEEFLKF